MLRVGLFEKVTSEQHWRDERTTRGVDVGGPESKPQAPLRVRINQASESLPLHKVKAEKAGSCALLLLIQDLVLITVNVRLTSSDDEVRSGTAS